MNANLKLVSMRNVCVISSFFNLEISNFHKVIINIPDGKKTAARWGDNEVGKAREGGRVGEPIHQQVQCNA